MIADAAILQLPKVSLQAKQLLPEYSGIYYLLDETNTVWYIGKAINIRKRWQGKAHHRIYQLEAQRKHFTIYYEPVSKTQLDEVEKQRIEKYQPHLNASPVKTKKVRPTETLLRETIAAIADFAFILGVEPPRKEVASQINVDWLAFGILNNRQTRSAPSYQFNTVYLLASVEKNAWLLVEEYLKGFAKPATGLSNGEGDVQKFYVSARKFVVPAKVNIKLENIGYSAWIPFGTSAAFPTYEAAKEEITRRLKNSDLPGLKLVFKRETITK